MSEEEKGKIRSSGVPLSHDAAMNPERSATINKYWHLLLEDTPTLTAQQVAQHANATIEDFNDYWLALGFPVVPVDQVAFTHADVEAFSQWDGHINEEELDRGTALSLARAQSHLADRLATWQLEAMVDDYARRLGLDDTSARLVAIDEMENYLEFFQEQLVYSWKRQMTDLVSRVSKEVALRSPDHSRKRFPLSRAVGFVDMVSYTANSTLMGDKLVGLIDRFEYVCRSAVASKGGRVVKMIGDAVFFVADDLATGVKVATHLVDMLSNSKDILPVRAAVVFGDVFSRSGDIFGPPVNLAARLVDIAPTGEVLTDAATAAAIAAGKLSEGYRITGFPNVDLRGFGRVSPYLLSWPTKQQGTKTTIN